MFDLDLSASLVMKMLLMDQYHCANNIDVDTVCPWRSPGSSDAPDGVVHWYQLWILQIKYHLSANYLV